MTQDAIQVAPDVYSVLFENDRVRLLQYHMQPGDNSAPHSHPSYLAYSLSDGTITFHTPSGENFDADMESGQTIWREAEDHSATNNGSSDVRGLLFELK
jgi:quercetin dioxygenase-like cupin family protein